MKVDTLGNKLGTIAPEHQGKRGDRADQEARRVNKIDVPALSAKPRSPVQIRAAPPIFQFGLDHLCQSGTSRRIQLDYRGRQIHSPIGGSAAFVEPGESPSAVWILDTTGKELPRKVIQLPANVRVRGATWSPDGANVVLGYVQRSSDIVVFER
jgi:hypothetical protein